MKQKGFAPLLFLIFILIFVVLAYIGYAAIKNYKKSVTNVKHPTPTPLAVVTASPSASLIPSNDWKTYTNSAYKFEMQYPRPFLAVDTGPNQAEITVKNGGTISGTEPPILDTITFTDSNNIRFTLNIYPISTDSFTNTSLNNLYEYSGVCGTQFATSTLSNNIRKINDLSFKEVVQTDLANKNLTDFCFFNPLGNLMVLRNATSTTVVAMDSILASFKFTQ